MGVDHGSKEGLQSVKEISDIKQRITEQKKYQVQADQLKIFP
jgi:hypothetical protein